MPSQSLCYIYGCLAIEEQFYILWPLLLWLSWKRKFCLLTITTTIALLSFSLNLYEIQHDQVSAFYSPQTRFWELMAGALLAWINIQQSHHFLHPPSKIEICLSNIFHHRLFEKQWPWLPSCISFSGLALILGGFLILNKEIAFPGAWALLPVLGAVLIIFAGQTAWINRNILSSKTAVWFGLISYPLYLWHWPLLSFAYIFAGDTPIAATRLIMIIISVIFAWLTYKFIEMPIRRFKLDWKLVITLSLFMMIIGFLGILIKESKGFPSRIDMSRFNKIYSTSDSFGFPADMKLIKFKNRSPIYIKKSALTETTLYLGDSNIEQYYPRISELIRQAPKDTNSVIFVSGGGCFPITNVSYKASVKHCIGLADKALKIAIDNKDIKTIVIGANWMAYLNHSSNLIGNFREGELHHYALEQLKKFILKLKSNGKNVYLVLNIPTGKALDPKYTLTRNIFNFPNIIGYRKGGIARSEWWNKYGEVQNELREVGFLSGAIVITPFEQLCNSTFCPSIDKNGEPIYRDKTHLHGRFVREHANFIDITVMKK